MGLVGCVEGRFTGDGDRLALDKEFGSRIDRKCEELGLIVRPLVNMCVFSPPLIITEGQIDEMFDILEEAVHAVATEVQAGAQTLEVPDLLQRFPPTPPPYP